MKNRILGNFATMLATSSTTFYILDFVKDMIFYLLLRKTFVDLEANCETQDLDQCFLPSSAEYAFPHGMISSVVLANMVTGAYCFSYRESIATRPKDPLLRTFYDLGFLAISPLLPICFQIRLAGLTRRISKLKDQFKSNKNVGEFFLKR